MASAIRTHDWSQSLGDPALWPRPLKTLVGVMLASKQPMFLAWGGDRTWFYNDAFIPILGRKHPGALGRPALDEVWVEARAALEPLFERVFSGEAVHMQDFALDLDRRGRLEEAHFSFSYTPVRDEAGFVSGLFGACIETTEQVIGGRRMDDQRRLLTRELEHRMKNLMAMVGAIINQSFRGTTSLVDIRRSIAHRVSALSHAHEILIRSDWESAPMASVVDGALAPHRVNDARFVVRGPDLLLAPKPALSLSLAINELATNAVKYGALSAAGGQVEITWRIDGSEPEFHFDWRESGGPMPTRPSRSGFGLRLIERALSEDFGGEVGIDFLPHGIHCHVRTRLAGLQPEKDAAQDDPSAKA